MKKRIISLLLGVAMAISMVGLSGCSSSTEEVAAEAATEAMIEGENGNIYVDLTTGSVYKADRNVSAVEIPEKIDGVTIVAIEDSVFKDKENLVEVILPDTLESIGQRAFSDTALTEITLPDSLTTLDVTAFAGTDITELVIPASVTTFEGTSTGFDAVDTVTFLGQANVSNMDSQAEYSDYTSDNISPLFVIGALNPQEPQTIDEIDSDLRPFFISYEFTYAGIPAGATIYYEDASFEDIISKTFDQNGNQVYNWVCLGEEVAAETETTVAEQVDGIDTEEEAIAEVEVSPVVAEVAETADNAEMAQVYLNVINDASDRFDYFVDYKAISSQLIDMDNDGVSELCLAGELTYVHPDLRDETTSDTYEIFRFDGNQAIRVYTQGLEVIMGEGALLTTKLIGNGFGTQILSMAKSWVGSVSYYNYYVYDVYGNEALYFLARHIGEFSSRDAAIYNYTCEYYIRNEDNKEILLGTASRENPNDSYSISDSEMNNIALTIEPYGLYYSNGEILIENEVLNEEYTGSCVAELEAMVHGTVTTTQQNTSTQSGESAQEILEELPYNGDISQINMSREQALGLAQLLRDMGVMEEEPTEFMVDATTSYFDHSNTLVSIFDSGNDTFSIFINGALYVWNDNQWEYWNSMGCVALYGTGNDASIFYTAPVYGALGPDGYVAEVFVENGLFSSVSETLNGYFGYNQADGENDIILFPSGTTYADYLFTWDMSAMEFVPNTTGTVGYILVKDGIPLSPNQTYTYEEIGGNAITSTSAKECMYSWSYGDWGVAASGNYALAQDVVPILEAYGEIAAISNYTYPEVTNTTDLDAILADLAAQLGGEIVGVYDLGDGVYYVIIDVSGSQKGGLICSYKENGKVTYRIENTYDSPESQENLDDFVANYNSQTNVTLDFNKVNSLTSTDEFVTYIQSALDNMDGLTISDSSKNELVTFLENAITSSATVAVSGTNNVVTLTASDIANSLENAQSALATYEGLLSNADIELNKGITLIIRIIGNQLDVGEPMEVILNGELADAIQDEMLQIYLGSSNHAIQITAENLKLLIAEYGTVSVQIQCNDDGTYTVNFLDEGRNIIEKMVAPVTIFLPCDHEFFTVMARYGTEVDNWGGQFSDVDNAISFSTSYTGIYELLDNSQTIADIGDLPEETQTAIQFMVSKGFFTVDENENFRPDENLARQDATKALVSMFFTLDRTLTCDFSDVLEDSYYYSYIASAAADGIVLGYDDGTFQGGNPMTTEELLAIVSRTLVEKKGYFYPENPESYLSTISGADQTTAWAQEAIALAIRDGIILAGEEIDPTAPITREQAALYLYRLFMLLEEVSPVAIDMDILTEAVEAALPDVVAETEPEETAEPEEVEAAAEEEEETEESSNTWLVVLLSLCGTAAIATPTAIFLPKYLKKIKNGQ